MKKTLLTLALATLAAHAQAATWTLGDTSTGGLRTGVATLTDNVENNQLSWGWMGSDLNKITVDSVAVGSWDTTSATSGSNSIDMGVSHEAYARTAYMGDSRTAYANLKTSVSLDNANIVDAGLHLAFAGTAPARLTQSFFIAAELGESTGDLVNVNMEIALDGNVADNGIVFSALDAISGYTLFLNDSIMGADSFDALGHIGGNWSFQAHIGDEIRLEMRSQSQLASIGSSGLAVGATPELFVSSEAFASMTVTTVPEPETWAMLVMGLGLVSLRLRNKSKSVHAIR
jgi:hypothetical protein